MLKLKDRQRQIPGGYQFYLPELKWKSTGNYPSFAVIVSQLQRVILANPYLAKKNNWPLDQTGVENWVDVYNATICAKMGWNDYITTGSMGATIPKSQPPSQSLKSLAAAAARAKELVAGAQTLIEWIDSKEEAVSRDLAQQRAEICSSCPKNDTGDFTKWFTVPAAELIKRQVEKAQSRNLSTIHDEKLNLCTACHCPLKLKVHVPIGWIVKRLSDSQKTSLKEAPACWILSESR